MTINDPLDLDAIEARTNAATKGPWTVELEQCDCSDGLCSHGTYVSAVYANGERRTDFTDFSDADWQFLIRARTAVPQLVDEVRRLRADAAAELLPDWEAVYEPGNVSNYLISYANDEAAAKGAAEAWLRSQAEVTGRLEWQSWGPVTGLPDGYDAWFELAERHDDGIDTGPGIVVRRRTSVPAARSAAV